MTEETCRCGKIADMRCTVYKTGVTKMMCFDCAWKWQESTVSCPGCGKHVEYRKETLPPTKCIEGQCCGWIDQQKKRKGTLDRGITPVGQVLKAVEDPLISAQK